MTSITEAMKNKTADLIDTLNAEVERRVDVLVPTVAMRVRDSAITVHDPDTDTTHTVAPTEHAHGQLAQLLDIPLPYYRRMLEQKDHIFDNTLNYWLPKVPEASQTRLLRLRREEGSRYTARAVLSDRYRAIDHIDALEHLLPAALASGADVSDWTLNDTTLNVRFVKDESAAAKDLLGPERVEALRKAHSFLLDEVFTYGAVFRNSEVGAAAFSLAPFAMVLRCWNGYVVNVSRYSVRHVGARRKVEEDALFSALTKNLEDVASLSAARDVLSAALDRENLRRTVEVAAGGELRPLGTATASWKEVTETFGAKHRLSLAEKETLIEQVAYEAGQTGRIVEKASYWTLAQGITAMARDLFDTKPDRAHELATLGYDVLADAAK